MSYTTHVAIGCNDLKKGEEFYLIFPFSKVTRRYEDRICLDFYSIQLVLHKFHTNSKNKAHYPYHFGINFSDFSDLENIKKILNKKNILYNFGVRFKDTNSEHHFLSIFDPTNNCLEFKNYINSKTGY